MVTIESPRSPRSRGRAKLEKWGWLYMRLSGALLIVLIFTHLFINLFITGVQAIDFGFVAGKWAQPLWKWWDGIMLWLAMIHGTNGMRTIINDYAERVWLRKSLVWLVWIVCAAIVILGTLTITTFDPCNDSAVNTMKGIVEHCSTK